MNNNWIALHAFYHNYQKYDDLICNIITELEKYKNDNMIEKWFFIRYWEGGPHFRFRFLNPKSEMIESKITKEIRKFILNNPSENKIKQEDYYKNSKFDGKPVNIEDLPWYDDGNIVNIKYEPEFKRYGGKNVMEYSESLFMESSYLVKQIILVTKNNYTKRLIYSSAITFILAKSLMEICGKTDVKNFLLFYKRGWGRFIESNEYEDKLEKFLVANGSTIKTVKNSLSKNKLFNEYLDNIKELFSKIVNNIEDDKNLEYIIDSHIHMTNNRLGITPVYEYYISEALTNVFSEEECLVEC